jgi:septation ring formation regulator EzrA
VRKRILPIVLIVVTVISYGLISRYKSEIESLEEWNYRMYARFVENKADPELDDKLNAIKDKLDKKDKEIQELLKEAKDE